MKVLIQRVRQASVTVDEEVVGGIDRGLLVFLGVEQGDGEAQASRLADRVLAYRVFPDASGKMNRSVCDVGGGLLVVSQFTLAADTDSGNRPSFTPAAAPDVARSLYEHFVAAARKRCARVETGCFAADMQVSLVNDGPVTFLLRMAPGQGCARQV